jgi:hypothetical protein
MSICNKEDHVYTRYYCKLCEDFHYRDTDIGQEHKEHKINRYWCPLCGRTHIAHYNRYFLMHLNNRGKEISYFGSVCATKSRYCSRDIVLSNEDAKKIDLINKNELKTRHNNREMRYEYAINKLEILLKYYLPNNEIPYIWYLFNSNLISKLDWENTNEVVFLIKYFESKIRIFRIIQKNFYLVKDEKIKDFVNNSIKKISDKLKDIQKPTNITDIKIREFYCIICNEKIDKNDNFTYYHPVSMKITKFDLLSQVYHTECAYKKKK